MASSSITRVCLICNKKNDSLDLLRKHVKEQHPRAMFTACLKSRFVSQATEAYCGGQTQVFDKILIPEVAAVFGHGDSDAYYGMPENDGYGIDEEQQEKADLKTPPSTYVEVIDRLIGSQDEMPVSEIREPLDYYPVNEDDDHEFINVDMSYEEGVLTQADNVDFTFDYDMAIKEMAAKDEAAAAAELFVTNPYSLMAVANSPRLPSDEFAEVKKLVSNCQDQVAQHFKTVEDCFKAMPDHCSDKNGKKLSAANLLMHKAEKVFAMLDRVLKNGEVVWDDEVSDLELQRVLDATQKQILEPESLPSPSLLVPVVIEDPIGLNFTQTQALDFSKAVCTIPKAVKNIVQSQAYDLSVKKACFSVTPMAELPSTSADTPHSFAVPVKPLKRFLVAPTIDVSKKVAKVLVSDDDDEDGERIRPKAFSIVQVPR